MSTRHKEDRLGGVVEAALNRCMLDEDWMRDMAFDHSIDHEYRDDVFSALESYIVNHLARIGD